MESDAKVLDGPSSATVTADGSRASAVTSSASVSVSPSPTPSDHPGSAAGAGDGGPSQDSDPPSKAPILRAFLTNPGIKKAEGVTAVVLFLAAVVTAGWGRWTEVVSSVDLGRPALAAALVLVAVTLFVLSRVGPDVTALMSWTGLVLLYALASWLLLGGPAMLGSDRAQGVAFGCISVAFLLTVASQLIAGSFTSALSNDTAAPTVLILWSAVVVFAIAFIFAIGFLADATTIACSTAKMTDCVVDAAWPDYLILLGVPGAAAAVAKARGVEAPVSTSAAATGGGATAASAPPSPTDRITEVQYFVFNVIAMLFVMGELWKYGRLGQVPDVLLGLTGASALTFALVKGLPAASSTTQ